MEGESLRSRLENLKSMLGEAGESSSGVPNHFWSELKDFLKDIDYLGPFGKIGPPVKLPITVYKPPISHGYINTIQDMYFGIPDENFATIKCPHCGTSLKMTITLPPNSENE